jgi:hypothetical protein
VGVLTRAVLIGLIASASSAVLFIAQAAAPDSVTTPDPGNEAREYSALVLDGSGNPVIAYTGSASGDEDLLIVHCNDPLCAGGDESVEVAAAGVAQNNVGTTVDLVLDASGNPVVTYESQNPYANPNLSHDLHVLHCNDPDCAGGDESNTAPDTAGRVGSFSSLALDAAGNPVVSYKDFTSANLKVMHCNDPNCSGGDESITAPDTANDVGSFPSLALDAAGNPVVSYLYTTQLDLRVMHCNDPNCSGGDESIVTPDTGGQVGYYPSLQLDSAGNPVVAYRSWSGHLKVLHCDDPNCAAGGDLIAVRDFTGSPNGPAALALDGFGRPVVAYIDNTDGTVNVLHCDDVNCQGAFDSITAPAAAGAPAVAWETSLSIALDGAGNPVVAFREQTADVLAVLHCGTNACGKQTVAPATDSDGDGCADAREALAGPGAEQFGGNRDSANAYDFYDVNGDLVIDLFGDILTVAAAFGDDADAVGAGEPDGYDAALDRSPPLPGDDPWDLQGPDGVIDLFGDIFGAAYQFGHDCA